MKRDVVLTWLVCLSIAGFLIWAGVNDKTGRGYDDDEAYYGSTAFRPSR
ncbi:hypothetical protein [Rhizobium sp. Root1220]|nr:hypothetical protein [Rhizobium sp. Root1220]